MRAIEIKDGHLVLTSREAPVPRPDEILLQVAASGVNRPDVLQRKGFYPPPPGASDIPGLEVAGKVIAIGSSVKRWSVGDEVTALVPGGGYAELCVVHESNALRIPRDFSLIEAAALPETFFTVWHNVFERGALKSGETLLVHGGTSGIGTTAIQLARAFGALVLATAGSAEKCDACLRLGAMRAIDYKTEDFVKETLAATDGKGADVILDMVGGDYIGRNFQAAALDGRIVQIAFQGSSRAEVDFRLLLTKRLTHTGSTLRVRPPSEKAVIARALEEKVWPLLDSGKVKPVIYKTFPLEEASAAHALMESSAHIGKIILS